MSPKKIYQRLEDLHKVLVYCSDRQKEGKIHVFKVGERICINQERGALFSQIAHANNESYSHEVREYKIPAGIEAKVKFTIEKIKNNNWS